jgi:hypothetical protein
MIERAKPILPNDKPTILTTRVLNAPRELVSSPNVTAAGRSI